MKVLIDANVILYVIVTRNLADFTNSPVPAVSPAELLNRIHATAP